MLLVKTLKCMFLIKNLRVYNIGKLSAAFSLSGPLCATFPYIGRHTLSIYNIRSPALLKKIARYLKTKYIQRVYIYIECANNGATFGRCDQILKPETYLRVSIILATFAFKCSVFLNVVIFRLFYENNL